MGFHFYNYVKNFHSELTSAAIEAINRSPMKIYCLRWEHVKLVGNGGTSLLNQP